jgi:hypothetical protein
MNKLHKTFHQILICAFPVFLHAQTTYELSDTLSKNDSVLDIDTAQLMVQEYSKSWSEKLLESAYELYNSEKLWKLRYIEIDESRLNKNFDKKEDLLFEYYAVMSAGLIYIESDSLILLASKKDELLPYILGPKLVKENNVTVQHLDMNCESCQKTFFFDRQFINDELCLFIKDEKIDHEDVYYKLVFKE